MALSHFTSAVICAFFASIVLGIAHPQRQTPRDMAQYGAYCFALFVGGVIVAGWVMWLIRH